MVEPTQKVTENFEKIDTQIIPPSDDQARWMFEYRMIYWDIKAKLMGGELTQEQAGDNKGNFVVIRKVGAKPFLNDEGINKTMALLNGYVSKIQALSQMDEERVFKLCIVTRDALTDFYSIHCREFGISLMDASLIIDMVMNNFETNMRKAIGGKGLTIIGGTERVIESRTDNPQKKKFLGINI